MMELQDFSLPRDVSHDSFLWLAVSKVPDLVLVSVTKAEVSISSLKGAEALNAPPIWFDGVAISTE